MKKFTLICLVLCLNIPIYSQSIKTVRFWVGQKNEQTSLDTHLRYIQQTLAPGTVVAGYDALENYTVYLPTDKKLPENSYLTNLPFSEAANPSYRDEKSYLASRARHPEYGPLHFVEEGFDSASSFSAIPQSYDRNAELVFTSQTDRIAYELLPEGADWQTGTTLVWLVLRNKNSNTQQYSQAVKALFDRLNSLSPDLDGNHVRVDEGYLLFFMNINNQDSVTPIKTSLQHLTEEEFFHNTLNSFELLSSVNMAPFAKGWGEQFKPGNVINVQFPRVKTED